MTQRDGGGRRRGLTRERVLQAAVTFVDAHGLPALTMRRLGAELGVEAMALYRYVPGREDLLDGVVELVLAELCGDPQVHSDPRQGWEDHLRQLAHGVRRLALAHPEVFPLVATRPPAAPWVRPPLRSLRTIEAFLAALLAAGFTAGQAVVAYRAFSSFLLGHLLLEVSQQGVPISAADEPGGTAPDDLSGYPLVVELQDLLSRDETATEFGEALEDLVERLHDLRA